MNREQFHRLKVEAHQRRIAELRMIAESRATSDQRYVRDAVAWTWRAHLRRKQIQSREALKPIEYRRLLVLSSLYAAA